MKHLIVGFIAIIIVSLFQPVTNIPKSEPVQAAPIEAVQEAPKQEPPNEPTKPVEPAKPPQNQYKLYIYAHESGECVTKWEGEFGACPAFHGVPDDPRVGYGLCQSTPANKMASEGPDWATSYETQDRWCTKHAAQYGGWEGAYTFWLANQYW